MLNVRVGQHDLRDDRSFLQIASIALIEFIFSEVAAVHADE